MRKGDDHEADVQNHYKGLRRPEDTANGLPRSVTPFSGNDLGGFEDEEVRVMEPTIVNGYDGFSGVHDNLLWDQSRGEIIYTLHNKLIIESVNTRRQQILADSSARISCLARSEESGNHLAAAMGEPDADSDQAFIFLYSRNQHTKVYEKRGRIVYDLKGIQSMTFSPDGAFLVVLSSN